MKIRIDKDIVEIIPEHASEAAELEALWIKMGNCTGGTKRLEPMGTYMKAEDKSAKFHIEGLTAEEVKAQPTVLAPYDTDVYCYPNAVPSSLATYLPYSEHSLAPTTATAGISSPGSLPLTNRQ